MSDPRVTKAMLTAARAALDVDDDQLALDVCTAVITAEDHLTRCVVVTRDPNGDITAHGIYASRAAAAKAIETGALASMEGTRAAVLTINRGPKATA